jgi:alanine racemase
VSRATSATVHIDALRHNLSLIRRRAPHSKVMAVVKADGYGHGLERVARALQGADAFGVAALADAERLRAAGLSQRIVLLSGPDEPDDIALLRRLQVDAVIHEPGQLGMLEAAGLGVPIRCWLKLDTGMHRLGFPATDAAAVHARLRAMPSVARDIVLMTHFARSDEFGCESTREQVQCFDSAVAGLSGEHSLSNSAGVLGWPQAHRDWVRPGGALYGLSAVEGQTGPDLGLEPAMTLSTRLIAVKQIEAGAAIGYGGAFVAPAPMRIGIAAIGYGDGYPRHAGSDTPVLVGGCRTRALGRVSMDLLAVDLSDVPEAAVGTPVVAWGRGLPVEEIAAAAGTLGYELACGITRRVRFIED